MQRQAITLAALAERRNLELATWKAARGKRSRPAVARFLNQLAGDIVWGCVSRQAAAESVALLAAHLADERALSLKPRLRIARSAEGTQFCGFRIRQGVILASRRKLARFRAALQRIERVAATGRVAEADLQRASELALATLDGCQSLGFRQRLLAAHQFRV